MKLEFYEYCKSYYGKDQIYDRQAPNHVIKSVCSLVAKRQDMSFDGDCIDRATVGVILKFLGYHHR